MKIINLILFTCFTFFLKADISKYFKKCENKSTEHSIHNIDYIYLINLDKRPNRLKRALDQLYPHGIYPYRFSAVNGYALNLEELNNVGLRLKQNMLSNDRLMQLKDTCNRKNLGILSREDGLFYRLDANKIPTPCNEKMTNCGRTYFSVYIYQGGIGCVLSHLSILQDAYDSNYETIWILEDDIEVLQDPMKIPPLIEELDQLVGKDNWDILYTDIEQRSPDGTYNHCRSSLWDRPDYSLKDINQLLLEHPVGNHFRQIGSRCGTHSMIVRRSGMKKILDHLKTLNIFYPIDMEISIVENLKRFALNEDIVTNEFSIKSDAINAWDLIDNTNPKK